MTQQKQPYFEVHVFGGWSEGESIVLRLPDGAYGVVDSCVDQSTDGFERNPVAEFLTTRNVSELKFLCLTHPHRDHFRGMLSLFQTFKPQQFWHPAALTTDTLKRLIKRVKIPALEVNAHSLRDASDELQELYVAIAARMRSRKKNLEIQRVSINSILLDDSGQKSTPSFAIKALAPHGNDVFRFEESLANAFDENGVLKPELPEEKFNVISVALLIACPTFRILLGGDVENASWDIIRRHSQDTNWGSRLFKVSHHGSKGAFSERLKSAVFAENLATESVVTGFKRSGIPDASVLSELKGISNTLGITHHRHLGEWSIDDPNASRKAIAQAFGIHIKTTSPGRAALEATFKIKTVAESKVGGRCSYYFDRKGNMIGAEAVSPATWI